MGWVYPWTQKLASCVPVGSPQRVRFGVHCVARGKPRLGASIAVGYSSQFTHGALGGDRPSCHSQP